VFATLTGLSISLNVTIMKKFAVNYGKKCDIIDFTMNAFIIGGIYSLIAYFIVM
jgi:hypothetical protein